MIRWRLSIAAMMGLVLWAGLALAALKEPSPIKASLAFTLAVVVFLTSILGTVSRRGRSRWAWAGALLFGGSALALGFGPWPWLNADGLRPPPVLTTALLDRLKQESPALAENWEPFSATIRQKEGGDNFEPADLSIRTQGVTTVATGKQSIQAYLIVRMDISPYKQVAHSLGSMLFAALGGWLGWRIAPRVDESSTAITRTTV